VSAQVPRLVFSDGWRRATSSWAFDVPSVAGARPAIDPIKYATKQANVAGHPEWGVLWSRRSMIGSCRGGWGPQGPAGVGRGLRWRSGWLRSGLRCGGL